MKTKVLIENGNNGQVSLTALEIPLIARDRDSLRIERDCFLDLVGRIDENGGFIEHGNKTRSNPREIPRYLLRLNPRVLILQDGRVFYNILKSDPSAPSETYEVGLFLEENFGAYGLFKEKFKKLYEDFKNF